MKVKQFYQASKSHQNYLVELFAFIPFIIMIGSGVIMLIYHINANESLLLIGVNRKSWLLLHKLASCIALIMVLWHLLQHYYWFKNLIGFKLKNKFKRLNVALLIIFIFTVITAFIAWLVFPETTISKGLLGIHSKLGFIVIILFYFHIKNYFSWLKKMTLNFINF